jgi:hypothetical protein
MENRYASNLNALKNIQSPIADLLANVAENTRFELTINNDMQAVIHDALLNIPLYKDAQEFQTKLEEMKHYREYLFLYMFGIGDGRLLANLLENKKHQNIVIIEPEIELLYIVLHLFDFVSDILSKRLILLTQKECSFIKFIELFHEKNAKFYMRVFHLHIPSEYYFDQKYSAYEEVLSIALKSIRHISISFGNNVGDTLLGLRHHIQNMMRMIHGSKFSDFLNKKNTETAIIVSTGPSLIKQLPLLKQYAPYVTIISVDASFPILVRNNIRPDIVVSMERDEVTCRFFTETSQEEQEGIIFVCASLQHKAVFDAIKSGNIVTIMRPFGYNYTFDLNDFGYLCAGMSAANMAHELSTLMQFKQCLFIGQDLAYGIDGMSHSKGHLFGEDQIKDGINKANDNEKYDTIELPAYGGKGTVKSMPYWEIFLRFIEQHIENTAENTTPINCTEGGAHIKGSIEIPFKDALERYAATTAKQKIQLTYSSTEELNLLESKVNDKINLLLRLGKQLQEKIEKSFLKLADACTIFEHKSVDEALENIDDTLIMELLDEIEKIRDFVDSDASFVYFFISIAQSMLYDTEIELARIKVQFVDNPRDNKIKAIQWILGHRYWLFSLAGLVHNTLLIIDEESKDYRKDS